jgi:rSAM/selenodomain-associated transferase 1
MPLAGGEPVAIAILAKAPVPGTVKTRLTFMLGVDGAAALQTRFIVRTVEAAAAAALGPITLWTSPDERHPVFQDMASRFPLTLARQPSGDLGTRMLAAFTQGNGPTLLIGTDCPVLTAGHLTDAAAVLRSGTDAVFLPADDGGYVLVGLRRPIPELFGDMAWSTDAVMLETRRRLTHLDLSWREPANLWDVDRPTDVRRMHKEGLGDLLAGIHPAERDRV